MKVVITFSFLISVVLSYSQNVQDKLYPGMSVAEFKKIIPNLLPEKVEYSNSIGIEDNLYGIEGKWSFTIFKNKLNVIQYHFSKRPDSRQEFESWLLSSEKIIEEYTSCYGKPIKDIKGKNEYTDRDNFEYQKGINGREVFYELLWETKSQKIVFTFDYRSNYYTDFERVTLNAPPEWFSYTISIVFSSVSTEKETVSEQKGKLYLGMQVSELSKVFPDYFNEGIKTTGR